MWLVMCCRWQTKYRTAVTEAVEMLQEQNEDEAQQLLLSNGCKIDHSQMPILLALARHARI